jgi:3'(2'), 5'-bisphosphate nucleotidase
MDGGAVKRIHASEHTEPDSLRILESVEKSHASHERAEKVRLAAGFTGAALERLDSMEKYARIAAGDADLYLRLPRQFSSRPFLIWDHAAGTVLVQAAGGMVTDVDGSPLDWSQGRALPNKGIIVSNGRIHERVLAAVGNLLDEEGKAQE